MRTAAGAEIIIRRSLLHGPHPYFKVLRLSRAFADFVESYFDLERVGEYRVRGFNDPIELFAYNG
jgi:hypothetical protein